MARVDRRQGRKPTAVWLRAETIAKADELAGEAGLARGPLLAELLEELIPNIESVTPRRGLRIALRRSGRTPESPGQRDRDVERAALGAAS